MGDMRYMKIGSWRRCPAAAAAGRGFRLNPKRFSVQRIRERFMCLFRLFSRWRSYRCCHRKAIVRSLKRGILLTGTRRSSSRNTNKMSTSTTGGTDALDHQVHGRGDCGFRASFRRSNSFYSEAISDCLEFIKSSEQKQACPRL